MPYPITITPRRMTADEKLAAQQLYPNLNVNAVWVIGEATPKYNCIAWTVGITDRWVWPGDSLNRFNLFYNIYHATPSVNGAIAAYANTVPEMTHGSAYLNITQGSIGSTWTSKRGKNILITHDINGLQGSGYGTIVQRYGPLPTETEEREAVTPRKWEVPELYILSADELDTLERRIAQVNDSVKQQFTTAYAAWVRTWSDPIVAESSNPEARARSKEFQDLVAMGPNIIPLLMERLRNEDEFFALQAVERLIVPELVFRPEIEDEAFLGGEQSRAAETLRSWIAAVGNPTPRRLPRSVGEPGTPYMSQANAVGQGFDVFGQFDISGLTNPLFDVSKAPTQTFTFLGNDYLIPTYITPVQDTRGYYSGGTYESRDSLQSSIAAHAGVNIGYGAFSGEMKADYSGEFTQNTHYAYAYNNFYAPLAYLQLNNYEQYLSSDFTSHLAALPDTFDPTNDALFVAFFQRYGGSYTKRITLGGSFSFYVSVEQSSGLSEQSIDVTFNAQYNGLVNSGSIDASVKVSQAWQSYTQASKTHIFVSGGDPTKIAALEAIQSDPLSPSPQTVSHYQDWAASLAANPAIVDFSLSGIWDLCGTKGAVVQQAWQEYSQQHRPRLTISTQSQEEDWSGGNPPLPAAIPPVITLAGTLIKPEQAPASPAGFQLVILENNGEAITDPGAILFNQYYSIPPQGEWMDTYGHMYDQIAGDLEAFVGSGALFILASFGLDNNMPPTNDAYTQLSTAGAGDRLTFWENHSDPGSMVGNATAWVSYPADYILVSMFDSGPGSGIEVFDGNWGGVNPVSDQLEVFLFKQNDTDPYTLGM